MFWLEYSIFMLTVHIEMLWKESLVSKTLANNDEKHAEVVCKKPAHVPPQIVFSPRSHLAQASS